MTKIPHVQAQLHLRSQQGQPYGSERRCCNNCGVMLWGNGLRYTESESAWATAPDRCGLVEMPELQPRVADVVGQPDPVMVDAARRAAEVLAELTQIETVLQQITTTTRLRGIRQRLAELRDILRPVTTIDDVARRRAWADADATAARVVLAKPGRAALNSEPTCGCHCNGGCGDPYAACLTPCPEHVPL